MPRACFQQERERRAGRGDHGECRGEIRRAASVSDGVAGVALRLALAVRVRLRLVLETTKHVLGRRHVGKEYRRVGAAARIEGHLAAPFALARGVAVAEGLLHDLQRGVAAVGHAVVLGAGERARVAAHVADRRVEARGAHQVHPAGLAVLEGIGLLAPPRAERVLLLVVERAARGRRARGVERGWSARRRDKPRDGTTSGVGVEMLGSSGASDGGGADLHIAVSLLHAPHRIVTS